MNKDNKTILIAAGIVLVFVALSFSLGYWNGKRKSGN